MEIRLKNVRIFDGKTESRALDILIRDGIITAISDETPATESAQVWQSPNLCVSPGWLDVGVHAGDPGFEHREDFQSVVKAAALGGYTAIACFPNTEPALHAKSEVLYVRSKTANFPVKVFPIGAVSVQCAGKDLAELFDMHHAGAVAFSDGSQSIQDAGLLLRSLQYTQAFNGLVFNVPQHKSITGAGQMHEGVMSTSLGLKGIPVLAETLMVQRDLSLLEYTAGRLHIHLISTAKSVELIRAAKASGLPVTASVAIANLCFTDEQLETFDANWKTMPPLRTNSDKEALLEGLGDGTIDFIVSNHTPWHEEAKNLEFPYAEFGMIGLETAFSLYSTFLKAQLDLNMLVDKICNAPRRILGLDTPKIAVGEKAELSVFDPDLKWVFQTQDIGSKSRNTPFIGQEFIGKVIGIIPAGS